MLFQEANIESRDKSRVQAGSEYSRNLPWNFENGTDRERKHLEMTHKGEKLNEHPDYAINCK